MKISKFVNIAPKENIFHSNDLAKVANGGTIGSTNAESFGQRVHTDRNRQTVRRYGDSLIGHSHMREAAQARTSQMGMRSRSGSSAERPGMSRPVMPQRTFREPPTRGYNPYL